MGVDGACRCRRASGRVEAQRERPRRLGVGPPRGLWRAACTACTGSAGGGADSGSGAASSGGRAAGGGTSTGGGSGSMVSGSDGTSGVGLLNDGRSRKRSGGRRGAGRRRRRRRLRRLHAMRRNRLCRRDGAGLALSVVRRTGSSPRTTGSAAASRPSRSRASADGPSRHSSSGPIGRYWPPGHQAQPTPAITQRTREDGDGAELRPARGAAPDAVHRTPRDADEQVHDAGDGEREREHAEEAGCDGRDVRAPPARPDRAPLQPEAVPGGGHDPRQHHNDQDEHRQEDRHDERDPHA